MAHHKDLTGSDLHEPKGAATATSGQVYVANGLGSGAWTTKPASYVALTRTFTDISTADDMYLGIPIAGTIVYLTAALDAGISAADSHITFSINGVSVDSSTITVPQTGVTGEVHNATPTGHNTVAINDSLKISTDGASSTTARCSVTVLIRVS